MSGLLRVPFRSVTVFRTNVKLFHNTTTLNVFKSNASVQQRVDPFSLKGIFKHYELLPLVGIVAVGTVGLSVYAVYFCNTRNDVQFRRQAEYDPMDLQKPPVLKIVSTVDYRKYQPIHEVGILYKEMAQAEEELKKSQ